MVFDEAIKLDDLIQIIIASILLLTAIITGVFSYKSLKEKREQDKINLLNTIVAEERSIKIRNIKNNLIYFDFYEYLAILGYKGKINADICVKYFRNKFLDIYFDFMNCRLYKNAKERKKDYPYLTTLFNELGLSIKKVGFIEN
jgi:hypothetical protein